VSHQDFKSSKSLVVVFADSPVQFSGFEGSIAHLIHNGWDVAMSKVFDPVCYQYHFDLIAKNENTGMDIYARSLYKVSKVDAMQPYPAGDLLKYVAQRGFEVLKFVPTGTNYASHRTDQYYSLDYETVTATRFSGDLNYPPIKPEIVTMESVSVPQLFAAAKGIETTEPSVEEPKEVAELLDETLGILKGRARKKKRVNEPAEAEILNLKVVGE